MSQQPPWGEPQNHWQSSAGETPSGVPAPAGGQHGPAQSWTAQNGPGQQGPGQGGPGQHGPGQGGPGQHRPVPDSWTPGAPQGRVAPGTWLRRYPRVVLLAGAVLSVLMMLAPWLVTRITMPSSGSVTVRSNGLQWVSSGVGGQGQENPVLWNTWVLLSLVLLLALIVMGSIALALDEALPARWDLVGLLGSGILAVLMVFGVAQQLYIVLGRASVETSEVSVSTGFGLWLFIVTVLATLGGAIWQVVVNRGRAARPAAPGSGPLGPGPLPPQWNQQSDAQVQPRPGFPPQQGQSPYPLQRSQSPYPPQQSRTAYPGQPPYPPQHGQSPYPPQQSGPGQHPGSPQDD